MGDVADLLGRPGVDEVCDLRSRIGFMAFHGGALELGTDVIASAAAQRCGASYYGVLQPDDLLWHIPSTRFRASESPALASFLAHVDLVVTVHGYGRRGMFTSALLGGRNRGLAGHLAATLSARLPVYDFVTDLDSIPVELRGLHTDNPVNVPPDAGVQIELPPRLRGSSPLWWDWEGPEPPPHTTRLIDALADAMDAWTG